MAARAHRPTILVLLGAYWPGNEATGPNQSFRGLAQALSEDYLFKVVGRDRPRGPAAPDRPAASGWIEEDGIAVRRCPVSPLGAAGLADVLRSTRHDALVLNGFFDREFTLPALLLRRMGLVPAVPTLLSPRGEFATGARALKSARKRAYRLGAQAFGLLDEVWLHATCEEEKREIESALPRARILLAPNIRPTPRLADETVCGSAPGEPLRVVFLSRIDRMKNLDFAIRVLASARVRVQFDIYGPIRNSEHWAECQRAIEALPSHVEVRYRGALPHDEVHAALAGYDLFFLPTRGENFGHAIFDALEAGIPVLLSDQTPWVDVETRSAGWALPLDRPDLFGAAIEKLAAMPREERQKLRRGARRAAEAFMAESDAVARSREMLRALIESVSHLRSGAERVPLSAPTLERSL